ncbi:MAG: hypothetical protein IJM15_05920 [Erysipelotrichaceae bacterium]|nr:hypothetical protein [Erysipelotrichaceae bacterium]
MKNKKLAVILLTLLLALGGVLATIYGKKNAALDLQYRDGYKLVYDLGELDEEELSAAAEVLSRRLENFACNGKVDITDGKLTLSFTTDADLENLRRYLPMKGEVTLRNTDDEILLKGDDLAREPFIIGKQNDTTNYISVEGNNTTNWKEVTTTLASKSAQLVIWVDFEAGTDSYKNTHPNYLSAATVNSVFDSGATFPSTIELETLKCYANVVNGGCLPAAAKEVSFEELKASSSSFINEYIAVIIAGAAAAGLLFVSYGKVSLFSVFTTAVYTALCLALAAFAEVTFNSYLLAAIGMWLVTGLLYQSSLLNKAKTEILRGRNASYSIRKADEENFKAVFEDNVLAIALGFVAFVIFSMKYSAIAMNLIIAAGSCLLVMVLCYRVIIKNAAAAEMIDYSAFGLKKEDLPDVEKGESYQQKEISFDFSSLLKIPFEVIAAVCGIILCILNFKNINDWKFLVIFAIIIALAVVYAAISWKRYYPLVVLLTVFCAGAFELGATAFAGHNGYILLGFSLILGNCTIMLAQLRKDYRAIAKEKVNAERISAMINRSLNDNLLPLIRNAVIFTAIWFVVAGCLFTADAKTALLCAVLTLCATLLTWCVSVKFWLNALNSSFNAKKGSGRKSDRSETVITGINNVR